MTGSRFQSVRVEIGFMISGVGATCAGRNTRSVHAPPGSFRVRDTAGRNTQSFNGWQNPGEDGTFRSVTGTPGDE